jgi:hypothetical protein
VSKEGLKDVSKGFNLHGDVLGGRCEAVMKGFYFSLDASSPNVTAARVRSLVNKLAGRLPSRSAAETRTLTGPCIVRIVVSTPQQQPIIDPGQGARDPLI